MHSILLAMRLPVMFTCVAATGQIGVQSDAQFKSAFDNHSSAPSFVMISVVDERSGVSKTGCTTPATLTHAIEIERGITPGYSFTGPSANIAIATSMHRFAFYKKESLQALGFGAFDTNYAEACRIIRSGSPAFQADRTGQIMVGQP